MSIGLVVAVAFGIEREAQRLLDQVSPNIPQVVQARAVLNPATGPATTFLILGSSRRPDQAPWLGNSDTMILVRLDPQHQLISMMSIPRDLQVAMPGYPGYQKIDAALSEGGPQLSIKVVQQVLGVPVNHYILVFWQGFFQMVQSIGGVYTEIDHRYYNPVGDSWTPIDLQPGYQLLNGNQALEYVRFRHLDTDIVREARQQRVLLDLREQATHRLGITDIPALLGVLGGSIQTDVHDVSTVLNLGEFLLNLPKGRIYHTTMDVSLGPSFVYADQAQISASVQRYLNPIVSGATTVASTSKAVPPRDVHVVVENANAGLLAAATVVGALRARGFDATSGGNAPPGLSDSTLYYTAAGAQAGAEPCRRPCAGAAGTGPERSRPRGSAGAGHRTELPGQAPVLACRARPTCCHGRNNGGERRFSRRGRRSRARCQHRRGGPAPRAPAPGADARDVVQQPRPSRGRARLPDHEPGWGQLAGDEHRVPRWALGPRAILGCPGDDHAQPPTAAGGDQDGRPRWAHLRPHRRRGQRPDRGLPPGGHLVLDQQHAQ